MPQEPELSDEELVKAAISYLASGQVVHALFRTVNVLQFVKLGTRVTPVKLTLAPLILPSPVSVTSKTWLLV